MRINGSRHNNGFIGEDKRIEFAEGRLTPSKIYNTVLDGYDLASYDYPYDYTPPKEWRALPSFTSGEQKFSGVYAIYNDTNYVALSATVSSGNYIVDWGDGTTGSFASNTQANKVYEPSVFSGLTSDLFRNYKTLVITVTPATANLTGIDLNRNYSGLVAGRSLPSFRVYPWLNVKIIGTNINSMSYGGNCRMLEQIDFIGLNSINGGYAHFNSLSGLKKIVNYYTGKFTRFDLGFNGCWNLRTIPTFDFSGLSGSVQGLGQMFYGCGSLTYVPWMDTSMVSNFTQMFYGCYNLVTVPQFNMERATSCNGMFLGCYNLKYIPPLNTKNVTNFSSMFQYCWSLRKVPMLNTSNGTNFSLCFYDANFSEFPQWDLSKGTNFDRMFYRVEQLSKVPKLDVSSGITFSQMFIACPLLESVDLTGLTGSSTTSKGRSFDYMFDQCVGLRQVKGLSLANAVTIQNMFGSTPLTSIPCEMPNGFSGAAASFSASAISNAFDSMTNLQTVGVFDVSGLTGATYASAYTNLFRNNHSLMSIGLTGIQHNFSISGCQFGGTALNNLYRSLAVVGASGAAAKTITVTSNWGATAAYGHDPTIAISKGWSVSN